MEKLISIELRNYIEKNDALNLIKWLSDFDIIQYMNEDLYMITTLNNILNNKQELLLTYYLNQKQIFHMIDLNNNPIGFIFLIPYKNNVYEIVIAIGNKELCSKQIAKHVLNNIINYIKEKLNGEKIIAKIHYQNIRSINLFTHLGFNKIYENDKYLHFQLTLNDSKNFFLERL